MRTMKSLKAKYEKHPVYKTPQRIHDIKSETKANSPDDVAREILKQIAQDVDINPDLSQLRFDKVKENIFGKVVLFQQCHEGIPISDAWVRIFLDKEAKVFQVINDLVPQKVLKKTVLKKSKKAQLTHEEASKFAQMEIEREGSADRDLKEIENELVYFVANNVPILTWKIIIKTTNPIREWKFYIDAENGAILDKIDLIKRAIGKGKVFNPNPVATLDDTSLRDNSKIPNNAYFDVDLLDLNGSGYLDGPYVSTINTQSRVNSNNLKFLFTRGNVAFNEVMVYYHIDCCQRYIQKLGFNNVMNWQIKVNVNGIPQDQSYYSSSEKTLTFGSGGVDDSEDAEVILHEYGHAIQDDIIPNFGKSLEASSMGEGFGDYLAGSFFADLKSPQLKSAIASWDACNSGTNPPCLRRLDSKKKYPNDMTNDEYKNCEIWSACLWEIRQAIGRQEADKLAIAHYSLISRTASFKDAANAILTSDEQLYQGKYKNTIIDIFTRRGILPQ